MLSFQNDGEIDLSQAFTFGMTSKVTNNPIGQFGTGLKYAVAVTLRNGGTFDIYVGLKRYSFKLKIEKSRDGAEHSVIFMNRTRLGFTTNLGKNWVAWQAFRELYCNTLDEPGGHCSNRVIEPKEGKTTIQVRDYPDMDKAFEGKDAFMLQGTPIWTAAGVEIFDKPNDGVFYRGILVHKLDKPARYTYNLTSSVELTEDRTLKYGYVANYMACNALVSLAKPELIEDFATLHDGGFEGSLNLDAAGYEPNDVFIETVSRLRKSGRRVLSNVSAFHDKKCGGSPDMEALLPTPEQQAMIQKGYEVILKRLGYDISGVPLFVVNSLGSGVYGKAHRGQIFISLRAFEAGLPIVVGTLLEEYGHIRLDWVDESRDMQNCLINLIARLLLEDKSG